MPHWHGINPAFRKVRAQYGACIAGAFLVSGMRLVDQGMASMLGPRSNSALNYGSKLVGLILSLGATSLGTAILPQLSKMVALKNWSGIQHFLKQYSRIILGVTIPGTLVLILLSRTIIRVMYQHGAFSSSDTDLVVKIQIFYLLRIPFSTTLRAGHPNPDGAEGQPCADRHVGGQLHAQRAAELSFHPAPGDRRDHAVHFRLQCSHFMLLELSPSPEAEGHCCRRSCLSDWEMKREP